MKLHVGFLGAAFALTAVSYGLARFAFGLLLPQVRTELELGVGTMGWIASGAFLAYCIGIVATFLCGHLYSPRAMACTAGMAATIGMAIVAFAASGPMLGIGIALAGLSTGLTSPPLATAVSLKFADPSRPKANGIVNAGTAAGIVLSGLASLSALASWRELYAIYALIGFAVTIWVFRSLPSPTGRMSLEPFSFADLKRPACRRSPLAHS